MSDHHFLTFVPPQPNRRIVREVAVAVLNSYFNTSLTRSRWQKQPPQAINWYKEGRDANQNPVRHWSVSQPVSLRHIEERFESGKLEFDELGLYNLQCKWLDSSVHAGPQFHAVGSDGTSLKFQMPTTLGASFPLIPALDREGYAFNSFQLMMLDRIGTLRHRVVTSSNAYTSDAWFQDLRALMSECVSLTDVTLHQLYFKAEHDRLPGWRFEQARLGPRHGRRLTDKLAWVYQITQNQLNAPEEVKAFIVIKDLRNHLQHFDPPCFCYSLEDVRDWLNATHHVAILAWKMRQAFGSPLCVPLIRLLLAPDVQFVPKHPDQRRIPQASNLGYGSTRW